MNQSKRSPKLPAKGRENADGGWSVYRRLLGYVKPYWLAFTISVLANIFYAFLDKTFVDGIRILLDEGLARDNPDVLAFAPYFIIGLLLLRGVAAFVSTYSMSWVGGNVVLKLRQELFGQYMKLPASYYGTNTTGDMISRVTYNTEQVSKASTDAITDILRSGGFIIFALIGMFQISVKLTLLFLIGGPLVTWVIRISSRRFRTSSRKIQTSMGGVTHVAGEAIDSYKVVKTFGGQEYEQEQFDGVAQRNRRQALKLTATKAATTPVVQLLAGIAFAVVLYVAINDMQKGRLLLGEFVAFNIFVMMLLKPLKQLTTVNSTLQKGIAAAQSIFGVLDLEPEQDTGSKPLERATGKVEFKNVSFRYPETNETVLKNINLTIEPGETIALVGRSGSGKSTLTNLLLRFYEPTMGQILVDGIDYREFRLNQLRSQIALVAQSVNLFNDTIAHNIAYGRLGNATEASIIAAARAAHAWEFIKELPEGLNTQVGEDGQLLSGGQRQRLAIARAMLKDAPILILDEATSSLDSESERHIQQALEALLSSRTTIVIAHRLSTIENADKILVVRKGEIVEMGSHEKLLAMGGEYTHLYNLQFND